MVFVRDHPRRCGENLKRFVFLPKVLGSPPQVRGKLAITAPDELGNGITPAGAGKTVPVFGHRAHNRDHPRRCGENHGIGGATGAYSGSPPQVRGKHACR